MAGRGDPTPVAAVIGSPVGHSRSPAIHTAAFSASGLNWVYLAFDVAVPHVASAVGGAAALGFRGLSVTMPLKTVIVEVLDELTDTARTLGAVNTVTFTAGRSVGDNTDGAGFLRAVEAATGWQAGRQATAVIGAGGAARAVILALAGAGATSVAVINRDERRAGAAARLGGSAGRIGGPDDITGAALVVNATPVGMSGTPMAGEIALDPSLLRPDQIIVDLVYHPVETPLITAARARGATAVDGLGMLVHQAALQFELWTGLTAPIAQMCAAARES